jgi:hypothetical protein
MQGIQGKAASRSGNNTLAVGTYSIGTVVSPKVPESINLKNIPLEI